MAFSVSESSADCSIYLGDRDDDLQIVLDILNVGRPWCPRSRQQYEDDVRTWEQRLACQTGIEQDYLKYVIYHICPRYTKKIIVRMNLLSMSYRQFKRRLGELWPFLDNGQSSSSHMYEHRVVRDDVHIYANEFEEEMFNLGEFSEDWLRRRGVFHDERVQIFFRNLPYTIRRRLMEEADIERFTWDELRARVLWHYQSLSERTDQWSTESIRTVSNDLSDESSSSHWTSSGENLISRGYSLKTGVSTPRSIEQSICIECYGAGHDGSFCPVKSLTDLQCGNCGGAHATARCRAAIVPNLDAAPGFAIHVTASGYHIKFLGNKSQAKSARRLAYALLAEADKLN